MTIKPIKTERDRQKGLKDVEKLWDAKPVLNKKRNLSVEMKRALPSSYLYRPNRC